MRRAWLVQRQQRGGKRRAQCEAAGGARVSVLVFHDLDVFPMSGKESEEQEET